MKKFMIVTLSLINLSMALAYNNPIEGGSLEVVSNQWNVAVPWLMVGGNSSSNSLIVTDGGRVVNAMGYIGNNVASTSNSVLVTGQGSVWSNTTELSVGYVGSSNTLKVADGGMVVAGNAHIGYASDHNLATVTGTNSELNATTLNVGFQGDRNQLLIANSGRVVSSNGSVGYWIGADNNTATVHGIASIWTNSGTINVGEYGAENRLNIENGGRVDSSVVSVGVQSISSNNLVSVSGTDSLLNVNQLNIGGNETTAGGQGNQVTVANGGTISLTDLNIYSGSSFELNDGGTISVNGDFDASLSGFNWNNGGNLSLSGEISGIQSSGSTEYLDGTDRTLTLNGGIWTNSGNIAVGWNGVGNQLIVTNGGYVRNSIGMIGAQTNADNNAVLVSGKGSIWENHEALYLGGQLNGTNWIDGGSGNSLSIENDGWVLVGNMNTNNLPNLGAFGGLAVGGSSGNSELIAANGSRIQAGFGYVGLTSNETGSVVIKGNNTQLDILNSLYLGYGGNHGSLDILDGAKVINQRGVIGRNIVASNNIVRVSGSRSLWHNKNSLYVGGYKSGSSWVSSGLGNSLIVEDYGQVKVGIPNTGPYLPTPIFMTGRIDVGNADGTAEMIVASGSEVKSGEIVLGQFAGETGSLVARDEQTLLETAALKVGANGSNNSVAITNGARVEFVGPRVIGITHNDGIILGRYDGANGNSLIISGEGSLVEAAVMPVSSNMTMEFALNVSVGVSGADNQLIIEDGGFVDSSRVTIGAYETASNNYVRVADAEWNNEGNLMIGGEYNYIYDPVFSNFYGEWIDGGRNNALYIEDGGIVSVGRSGYMQPGSLFNRNYSTVSIDETSQLNIAGNYYQDASSVLSFGATTNSAGMPTNSFVSVGGTAEFEEDATLRYDGNVGVIAFDEFSTNLLVQADMLVVGGVTNAHSLDLKLLNLDSPMVDMMLWENEQDIYGLVGRKHLREVAGFAVGSQMARIADYIDDRTLLGDEKALNQFNMLMEMTPQEQQKELTQAYEGGSQTYLHMQGMLSGIENIRSRIEPKNSASTPVGTAGPYVADRGMQGWAKISGTWVDRSSGTDVTGYDQSMYEQQVGIDKPLNNMLIGAAGGYARSYLDQADGESSDAKTGYGVLYATLGTKAWFGDFGVAYGRSSIKTESGSVFGATADFSADNIVAYVGGGKELHLPRSNFSLTPKASFLLGYYSQEAYVEKSASPNRYIDTYDRASYQSTVGFELTWEKTIGYMEFKPEVQLNWIHEFNSDEDQMTFGLEGISDTFSYTVSGPVEDYAQASASMSIRFHEELELVLDASGKVGEDYSSHTLSGKVVYQFK